ncbi:ABC transporter substrate-binding protein [Patulibacter defluvii]|uniref:ABC transporter substrate-binding protein n=1 Tax=Patulibacter defluvii TaxID=3095358 RepID=UPI002A755FD4|nr:ABC transporter substrate-binding protein [Patulibacter sp. DM4]
MRNRWTAVLLTGGAALAATGCGGETLGGTGATTNDGGAKGAAVSNATLRYAMSAEPISLDPAVGTDSQSAIMFRNVYDRLIELAPNGHDLSPGLAEKWEVSDDGLTYTFHLREGVAFDDGTPLDADAVVLSLQRVLAIGKGDSSLFSQHTTAKDIQAVDPRTVTVKLKAPYAPFLQIVALFDIGSIVNPKMVEQHATKKDRWAERWFKNNMSGTGPFKLGVWRRNQYLTLQRSDSTWQTKAKLASLRFESPGDASTTSLKLRQGDVDVVDPNILSSDQLRALQGVSGVKIVRQPIYDAAYWVMNLSKKPFDDPKVRQAFSYAIDYDGIISGVVQDQGARLGGPVPKGLLAGEAPAGPFNHDVQKAKQLLAEAGHAKGLRLTSWYVDFGPLKAIAQVMQDNLKQIGVQLDLRELPLSSLVEGVEANRLGFYSWSSNPPFASADAILWNHFHSKAGHGVEGNLSHYENAKVDQLLDQARRQTDMKQSEELYRQAAQQIANDATSIFLSQTVKNAPTRDVVQGYQVAVIGGTSFRDVTIAE